MKHSYLKGSAGFFKVAGCVSNKIKPSKCNHRESVVFTAPSVGRHTKDVGFDNSKTNNTRQNFITTKQNDFVGKSTKFWRRKASATYAHISRRHLAADVTGTSECFHCIIAVSKKTKQLFLKMYTQLSEQGLSDQGLEPRKELNFRHKRQRPNSFQDISQLYPYLAETNPASSNTCVEKWHYWPM